MITTLLKHLDAAYRPAYLRGMLPDAPCHLDATRMRERAASAHDTAVTLPAPSPRIQIDTMPVLPIRLEPTS